ncbi:hypothetical protein EV1_024519 [Malus domestica]
MSRWKGTCVTAPDFPSSSCNCKIIRARAYFKRYESHIGRLMDKSNESKSPIDTEGHMTHTTSTVAGSPVVKVSLFTYAQGEARGMATKARIVSYDRDSIAIRSFEVAKHGVLVSTSAGNSGPNSFTTTNIAPWILTISVSIIDREFPTDVILGDNRLFGGVSLYCYTWVFKPSKVQWNIVVCDRSNNARVKKGSAVKLAGGLGFLLANKEDNGEELLADAHLIPAIEVGEIAANQIKEYIKLSQYPTATIIFLGIVIGTLPPAPKVAAFSSRRLNSLTLEILKPNVIAHGVNILAG